jgi:MATE family multidrug resistance protein
MINSKERTSRPEAEVFVSWWQDARDTIQLGVPIFFSMLSWVGMKTTDSALLGHVSAEALSAASLADLWTMCSQVFVDARVLGVLCGSAIGAGNPKLAGIYLQVSLVVLSSVLIFVFSCWWLTKQVWLIQGADPQLAGMAGHYARVLALSLPAQLVVTQIYQFFAAQKILTPEVNASSLALITNLLFGMCFVLGIPFPGWDGYGFPACPVVTTFATYVQVAVLMIWYIHIQRLHESCWPGWKWHEVTAARIQTFCELYVPSAFGLASDFWRVAVIGTVAATLGNNSVAVFNTSYRIMWIVMVLIMALSSASGIKISRRLGTMDHQGAKREGWIGIQLSAIVLVFLGSIIVWKIGFFGHIFTSNAELLELFENVRWPFSCTLVFMNLSVAIERVPYCMGRTKEVFWYGFLASWGVQVPVVFVLTQFWRNDLVALFTGMAVGYGVLVILYGLLVFRSDWKLNAELALQRSEVSLGESVPLFSKAEDIDELTGLP